MHPNFGNPVLRDIFRDGQTKIYHGLILFGITTGTFFAVNLFYFLLSKVSSLRRYKIQGNHEPTTADWMKAAKRIVPMYFYITLPLVLISTFLKGKPGPWPSWPRFVVELLLTAVIDDFLLYWLHRVSHWPSLYFMHKNHHEWLQPFGFTAAYMHPLEMALVSACSGAGGVLVLSHPYQIIPLLIVRACLHVEHHCGYAYPWNPQNWLPFCVGAHYHDWHHEAFTGNFGDTFNIWDRLFGTVNPKYWQRWEEYRDTKLSTKKTIKSL